MLRPGGYICETTPDGAVREADTFTCQHCCRVTIVRARARAEDLGGLCRVCGGLVCSGCVDHGCTPLEERLRLDEARQDALRSYGL